MVLSGASSEPTAGLMALITATVARWEEVDFLPWPQNRLASETLPPAVHDQMASLRRQVAAEVGTAAFAASPAVTTDHADVLEQFRRAGEGIVVRSDHEVMGSRFISVKANGDVVVEARVWRGEVTAQWDDETQRLVGFDAAHPSRFNRVDATPVYRYTVRQDGEQWRIVARELVVHSEDRSAAYGPHTPHGQSRLSPAE
jgi:hypothetical protein